MKHIISSEEDGRAVRDILRNVLGVSYTAMKSAKWDNRILIDGESVPVNRNVSCGEILEFIPKDESVSQKEEKPKEFQPEPYYIPLLVPYEDEFMMVIDKPAPLASQSSMKHPHDSLENAVYAYLGCPDNFTYHPVNRLDKGTSGLMVVAKDAHSQYRMQKQLHSDSFIREYIAVLEGIPPVIDGSVDAPIAKEPTPTIRRMVSPDGKPSVTHYHVEKSANNRSIVRLRLDTGRTHQIRVHMAYINCPVCGDFMYGTEIPEMPGRFALHSTYLEINHPVTGEKICVNSPMPEVMEDLLL